MNRSKKRGISPVIATVFLIALALVLAVIVFLWARSFLGESITKQNAKIETVCGQAQFEAEAEHSGIVSITNKGTVPLYGVEVRSKKKGDIKSDGVFNNLALYSGQSTSITVDSGLTAGEELLIVPILLGETQSYKKAFVCDQSFGQSVVVV